MACVSLTFYHSLHTKLLQNYKNGPGLAVRSNVVTAPKTANVGGLLRTASVWQLKLCFKGVIAFNEATSPVAYTVNGP